MFPFWHNSVILGSKNEGDSLVAEKEYVTCSEYTVRSLLEEIEFPLQLLCFCSSMGNGDFLLLTCGSLATQVLHTEWGHFVSLILPSISS